jgi:hypothetical protein
MHSYFILVCLANFIALVVINAFNISINPSGPFNLAEDLPHRRK